MSDSKRRRIVVEHTAKPNWQDMETEGESFLPFRWTYSRECRKTGFVNCRFKEEGGCQTPSHQNSY
jgi:hypothetical protein